MIDDQDLEAALGRIARTPDGRLMHIWLQRWLMSLAPTSESGALLTFEGERRFAARLKRPMDEAIAENSSDGSGDPAERPIVLARAGVVQRSASRGARSRVPAADPGRRR